MTSPAVPILSLRSLTKRFGRQPAVNDVSLDVFEQDVFGFLGPNGAGKSTTLYMIAGLVHPTSGSIEIFGHPHTDLRAVRPQVGALIETPAFYEYLSARKNLEILARLQPGIPMKRIDEVLEKVGLFARRTDRISEYSHGMKQRLGIAQALLNSPRLLLLDEPTNGLDPEGSAHVWEVLHQLVSEEKLTIFISSHLLHEVEEGCNRIAVINQGIIVACDEVRSLLFFSKEDCLILFDDAQKRAAAEAWLRVREGVEIVSSVGDLAKSGISEENALAVRMQQGLSSIVVGELSQHSCTPRAVIPQRKTLRQFFLELTRRQPSRLQQPGPPEG